MAIKLKPHEIIKIAIPDVSTKLTASDGTTIKCNSKVYVTNKSLILTCENGAVYRVQGKGDREFHSVRIPILAASPFKFIQPLFGPYKWETTVQKRLDLLPADVSWKVQLTFSSGGAIEFRQNFVHSYRDAKQAKDLHIEELLPAYSE